MKNPLRLTLLLAAALAGFTAFAGETLRVAAYNVENYLDQPTELRKFTKSDASKAKVRESIRAANPHVLALAEMGTTNALLELRAALKADGLDFPYWEHVNGHDPDIHVAVLSKYPITARRPHTNDSFLLDGRRFQVSRGFVEVDIRTASGYEFTLLGAHLKSRRPVPEADEGEMRLQEAKILRGIIDERLRQNPQAKLVVCGDFNDTKDSAGVRELIGRGKTKMTDTRPAERNGDNAPADNPRFDPRNITWTHFYGKEDSYSRIDYLFISPGMAKDWLKNETYIPTVTNWGVGSDHRPVTAGFDTGK